MKWIVGLAILLSVFLLAMGSHAFPLLGDDSTCFVLPALYLKKGLGLINPVDLYSHASDASGRARFMYYPPLFQGVITALMPDASIKSLMIALSILGVLCLWSMVLLWQRFLRAQNLDHNPWALAMMALALLGLMSWLPGGTNGRPEVLAMTWLAWWASALLFVKTEKPWQKDLLLAVPLGLDAVTQPVSAVLACTLTALYYLQTETDVRSALKRSAIAIGGTLVIFAAFLQFVAPYGLVPTLKAMGSHANRVLLYPWLDPAHFFRMYFTRAHVPAYGFIVLSALWVLVAHLRNSAQPRQLKTLSWVVFGVLVILIWHFALRAPARNYNLLGFAPLLFIAHMHLAMNPGKYFTERFKIIFKSMMLFVLALTGAGFLRKAVLFLFLFNSGISLEDAQQDFAKLAPREGLIYVTDAMWALSDDPDRMRYWINKQDPPTDAAMIIVQNNIFAPYTPPEIAGYERVFSSFSGKKAELLGVPVSAVFPGYEFAAYIPKSR